MQNGITHQRITAKWAQANREVERENRSFLKPLQIAQAEGKPWKVELCRYLMIYTGLPHSITGRSPTKLLFNCKMQRKIPDLSIPLMTRSHDCDTEQKAQLRQNCMLTPVKVLDTPKLVWVIKYYYRSGELSQTS